MDDADAEDKLPINWLKVLAVFAAFILINVVAALVSFGAGVIVTIPITAYLAFLLLRDILPRHRFPPGAPPQGDTT